MLISDNVQVSMNNFIINRKSQNLSKNTIKFYENNLKIFAEYCNANALTEISQLTSQFIQEFISAKMEQNLTVGTVLAYFTCIKAWLNWWFYENEPDYKNPIAKVKPPKRQEELLNPVTDDEFEKLLSACKKDVFGDVRDKAIFMLLSDTGIRASELCDIELEHVNYANNSIVIPKGKGNKLRFVFFTRETKLQLNRWLRKHSKSDKYLFSNYRGEQLKYSTLRQISRRRCIEAGINEVGLHSFRRRFALNAVNSGMDLLSASRLMGHRDTTLLSRYAKQSVEDLQMKYQKHMEKK